METSDIETWFHGLRREEQHAWLDASEGRDIVTWHMVERLPNESGPGSDDPWVIGPMPAYWLSGHHSLVAHDYFDPGGGDFHLSSQLKKFLHAEVSQLQSH